MECIFCSIVKKEAPSEIVFEDEDIIAFLDINPINYGHLLVLTKEHFDNFLTVPTELLQKLISRVQFLAGIVKRSTSADGFNTMTNNGTAAGQRIFHFHFHIIPRFENDFKLNLISKNYNDQEMKQIADRMKEFIEKYKGQLNG
ncbi:MAG: HIT family protein [Ignavibacterium sp.]|nr:HIT family protein [Ignavibacterium sp.]MCX7611401.1 HIT family protein [Ignavibacterium sp.]MDW8375245.1 HIT family protein [Ignavibacteriales bacterium]